MNDISVTVIGNVVNEVRLRFTKTGEPVASFRVASGTRRFDRASGAWMDGDTHYFLVSCWRGLAHNVLASVTKGMPVIVVGRLRSREVDRPCGDHSHNVRYVDIDASSVGPNLTRGTATFSRVKREAVVESERRALADAMVVAEAAQLVDAETGEIVSEPAA